MCPQTDELENYILHLKNGTIPVFKQGNGAQLMIVLHGFESNNQAYKSWESILGNTFTICIPDLPFHGQSNWQQPRFSQADIIELILAIAKKEEAAHFTLAGFSMGGRLIVCLGNELKNKINQFILLAPAGIGSYDKVQPLYLQRILEWLLQWPAWFKFGVQLFHRLGWISNFQKRYAEVQIFPKDHRYRLFRVFNSVLHFRTSLPVLLHFWHNTTIPILIVLGLKDRLIPNDKVKAYFAESKNCTIVEIDARHALETARVAGIILEEVQESSKNNKK